MKVAPIEMQRALILGLHTGQREGDLLRLPWSGYDGVRISLRGFKQYRLGEIIGMQTAGAVLAASVFMMGNGDLLLLAVADVTVDGQRLEGVGVTPTIEVPFDPVYAAGRDPQLDRAVQVLSDRIKG